ncbi:MAG: PE-PPE domain-containing protein [Gordonia sp. (in: high G+C Gram-positive bacteria)]|uniref:cutinase family protein n=1 Tax=Gordonia TaxID=2053 RepID=UPI003262DD7F
MHTPPNAPSSTTGTASVRSEPAAPTSGRPFRYLLAPLLIAAAAASVIGVAGGPARADTCGSGGAVVVAGTQASRDAHGKPTGGVTGIGSRYAAQGYRVTYVDYPTDLWPLGPISYNDDVALGKAATERAIVDYQRRCPGKPVVVAGYSQGARIAGDVLSDAANGRSRNVRTAGLSGELYSDPRRDGRGGAGGVENTLIGLIPGILMSGPRAGGFGTVPVTQVCVRGDGVCDAPDPLADPVGAADSLLGYWAKHGDYPWQMRVAPVAWRNIECVPSGATRDCVVAAGPSGAELARRRGATPAVTTALTRVVDGRPMTDPGFSIATFRPLAGGGRDSVAGDVNLGVKATALNRVQVDAGLRLGSVNEATAGVSAPRVAPVRPVAKVPVSPTRIATTQPASAQAGTTQAATTRPAPTPTEPILLASAPAEPARSEQAQLRVTVPVIDMRRVGDIAFNPSRAMGAGAPSSAIEAQQQPRSAAAVTRS